MEPADMDWYEGPYTKQRIADLRKKLAIARGIIEQVRQIMACLPNAQISDGMEPAATLTADDLMYYLKETEDP